MHKLTIKAIETHDKARKLGRDEVGATLGLQAARAGVGAHSLYPLIDCGPPCRTVDRRYRDRRRFAPLVEWCWQERRVPSLGTRNDTIHDEADALEQRSACH